MRVVYLPGSEGQGRHVTHPEDATRADRLINVLELQLHCLQFCKGNGDDVVFMHECVCVCMCVCLCMCVQ